MKGGGGEVKVFFLLTPHPREFCGKEEEGSLLPLPKEEKGVRKSKEGGR